MGEEAESVNSIGNKPEDVGGIEQHEPLVVSSSRARNGTNPSDTSPITLFQVNNLIQDESRARMSDIEDLVAQLRLEFKDIIKEMTEIQVDQGSADGDPSLSPDDNGISSRNRNRHDTYMAHDCPLSHFPLTFLTVRRNCLDRVK